VNDRMNHDSLSDMLDGLGAESSSAPAAALGTRVVGALRHRRRVRLVRAASATLACALVIGLGAAWGLGVFSSPTPSAPVRDIAHDLVQPPAPPHAAPAGSHLTLGYLTAVTNANGGELNLPEESVHSDNARPLGPRNAAEMLRGL
jgi:hypothetical protein